MTKDFLDARDNHNQTVVHVAAASLPVEPSCQDFTTQDNAGWTPLFHAIAVPNLDPTVYCSVDLVQCSDVNHTANDKQTPLHLISASMYATWDQNQVLHIATQLLNAGARYVLYPTNLTLIAFAEEILTRMPYIRYVQETLQVCERCLCTRTAFVL